MSDAGAWSAVGAMGSVAAAGVAAWAAFTARSAAREANSAAETLANIERERRHAELCPLFRVSVGPLGSANYGGVFQLQIRLVVPPALGHLDRLTAHIRDDFHTRGEGPLLDGRAREEIKRQVWGSFRLRPGVGPDDARADETGRETVYDRELPIGETLTYPIESNPPPPWSKGVTQEQWELEQGTVLKLRLVAEHSEFGLWTLAGEIDVSDRQSQAEVEIP